MSLNNTNIIASQRIGLSTTAKVGNKYQIMAGNRFRRVITLTNAGSALTSTLIAIPIDHRGIYNTDRKDKHTTRTFNDLRVYQSDEVTPIPFYLEGVDTHSCSLFVRVDIPVGSSTFIIEYGNPALEALSDKSVIPDTITDGSTIVSNWNASHITSGAEVLEVEDGDPVMNLHNLETRGGAFTDVFNEAFNSPLYDIDGANGHACLQFNGNKTLGTASSHVYNNITNPSELSVYVVARASTVQNYSSIYRNQTGNFNIFPFWNGSQSVFALSSDGGVGGGINAGFVANQWNICSGHYKKNTVNGMRTYRNNAIIAQRDSINADLHAVPRLWIASFDGTSQFSNADIAQIIVSYDNNFDGATQTTKRNDIYEYLNAKYRQYAGLQNVTIAIGAENEIFSSQVYEQIFIADNAGGQAWSNKIVTITLDTSALISAGKMRADCGDIRVQDIKGTNLSFYTINKNTTTTKIVIKVPTVEADSQVRIRISYGVSGRSSVENENNVIPAIVRNDSNLWVRGYNQSDMSVLVDNSQYANNVSQPTIARRANLITGLNGLQAIEFNSASPTWYSRTGGLTGQNANAFSIFVAGYGKIGRDSGQFHPFEALVTFHGSTNDVIFPDAFGRLIHASNNFNPFYTVWPGVEPTQNIEQALGVTFTNTVSNAVGSYRLETTGYSKSQIGNGIGYNSYHNENLWIGIRNYLSQGTNADVSEIIILNKRVTDTEARLIMNYINDMYHIDESSVVYTSLAISERQVIDSGYTYEYYSGVSNYSMNSKTDGDIGAVSQATSDVEILNAFDTTLTDCLEDWSESTLSTEQNTLTTYERQLNITSTATTDTVRVANLDKKFNRATFNQWQVEDNVDNTDYFVSDNDELAFVINCETGADITGYIRLYNTNKAPYPANKWLFNNVNVAYETSQTDPFGGNRATKLDITSNISANNEFLVFASKSGQHPEPLASFNGIHTASLYVKSSKRIYIAMHGSAYVNYVASSATTGSNKWERVQLSTTVTGYEYESFILRSLDALTSSDDIFIYAPTLTAGSVAMFNSGACDYIGYIPTLSDGLNYVFIPRTEFVGSGTFSQIEMMDVVLESSSNQTVQYSQFRYQKRYDLETKYNEGSLIDLTLASSDDDRATFDILPVSNQIIDKVYISDETKIKTVDYLSLINGIKFKDLPSWHGENMIFSYIDLLEEERHSYMIHEVLSMLFPSNFIDTDTIDSTMGSVRTNYMSINKEELVIDVINQLLRANVGIIRYNANTNKIQYVSGAELFNQTPTTVNNAIEYNEDKNDNKIMYNSITAIPYIATVCNSQQFIPWEYVGGFGGGGYEVQAHFAPFHFARIEIPLDELTNSAIVEDEIQAFVQRVHLGGFNFSTQSGGNVYNNTNIRINRVEIKDGKLSVNVTNLSGVTQYLVSIAVFGQFTSYIRPNPILNPSVKNSYTMINQSSINAVGLREYEIDQRFINHEFVNDEFSPVYTQFFDSFGVKDRYISTLLVKVANIACGDVITVNDRNNRKVTGLVTEIDEDEDFTNTVVIREL